MWHETDILTTSSESLAGPPFIRASKDLKSRTRSKNGSLPMRWGRTLSESSPTHAYAVYLGSSRGMQGHDKIRYLLGALAASAHPVALVLGHGGEVEQNKVHDEVLPLFIYSPALLRIRRCHGICNRVIK